MKNAKCREGLYSEAITKQIAVHVFVSLSY